MIDIVEFEAEMLVEWTQWFCSLAGRFLRKPPPLEVMRSSVYKLWSLSYSLLALDMAR